MRRIRIIGIMILMAMMLSACVEQEDPTEKRFSVLGDSFSSLEGTVDPETNAIWSSYPDIGITSPEQMWWHKVAVETGWTLEKNNSFSGSLICNLDVANYYGAHSYLRRMDNLGDPDVIFIFGGTNDIWDEAEFGDFVYSDWTEEQLCQIRPAIAYMFESLKRLYPRAAIYFLVDMDICSGGADDSTKQLFVESVHRIAKHCEVNTIDLWYIHKTWWHPDEKGQNDIARQVVEAMEADFNV